MCLGMEGPKNVSQNCVLSGRGKKSTETTCSSQTLTNAIILTSNHHWARNFSDRFLLSLQEQTSVIRLQALVYVPNVRIAFIGKHMHLLSF